MPRVRVLVAACGVLAAAAFAGVACGTPSHDLVSVTRSECATCHMVEYEAATQPLHVGHFPVNCADCHAETGWSPAKGFDHARFFVLDGKHAEAECSQCHSDGFAPDATPSECVGCHRDDYDASTFPGHDTFGTQCADCHATSAWKPARIADHDQFFEIDGKHVGVECASCHTQGYAAGQTPKDCVGCHLDDFDASPFPNHTTFPTTCIDCHSTSGWRPATLPNHDQFFEIDGKHVGVECASCHTQGYAAGQTPKDCVGCHRADYDASPYPGHSSFPTTCDSCHMTTGWRPASGGHPESKFPIASGAHKGMTCLDCHNTSLGPNGKGNADCVGCHTGTHSRARMDNKHNEVRNYPSGSAPPNFCLDCHPDGRNRN